MFSSTQAHNSGGPNLQHRWGRDGDRGRALLVGTIERDPDLTSPLVTKAYTSVYFGIGRRTRQTDHGRLIRLLPLARSEAQTLNVLAFRATNETQCRSDNSILLNCN